MDYLTCAFWSRVEVRESADCWPWRLGRDEDGYGKASVAGRSLRAHRLAYELANGPVPDGFLVLHRCDNPPCCNPAHLFVGTHADNHADMVEKGRGADGERNGLAKLTAADVAAIRAEYAAGGITQKALAARFGVQQPAVSKIVLGRVWR